MSQSIVLCADDYGLTAPVSRAILSLAEHDRVSAVSCMTTSCHWPEHARWIAPLRNKIDIGLHLTLVDEKPLTAMPRTAPAGRLPSIATLIAKSYSGRLALDEIAAELDAQLNAFTDVLGFAPAHIDGHVHAHVLPGIRDLVLSRAAAITPRPWLRNVAEPITHIVKRGVALPKAAFIAALGRGFAERAARAGLHCNDGFSGVYQFSDGQRDYAALFDRFLTGCSRRQLILCHPGATSDTDADWPLNRGAEYAFLASPAFKACLARRDVTLTRYGSV